VSFRRTTFVGIVVTVLAMVVLEGGLDVVVDRITNAHEERAAAILDEFLEAIELASVTGQPLLAAATSAADGRRFHVAVDAAGQTRVAGRPAEGVPESWLVAQRRTADGVRITAGLEPTASERLLRSRLVLDLIDLPLFIALAFLAAWLLSAIIARPVRILTAATERLTAQRFPDAVPVPPGDDELSTLASSFNAMASSIRRMVECERAFARYTAHELRTPLAAMRLQLERAQLGLVPVDEVLPLLERHTRRMDEILAALVRLARADTGDAEVLPLGTVLDEAMAVIPLERTTLDVRARPPAAVRVAHGRLVQQAMANLLDNAFRHGGGAATVDVEIDTSFLTFRVRDTGPGVPDGDLERLTEPFYRGDEHHDGLGLGLSLVSVIADNLEGSLELRNTGDGLEATLTLPVIEASAQPPSEEGLRSAVP
jgi:signal transduction histidine kinase